MNRQNPHSIAIIGSGPAGLMAAHVLASKGRSVTLFEKRPAAGRKLLVAGSSGLNITYDCLPDDLHSFYRGPSAHFKDLFSRFAQEDWIKFIHSLGIGTFKGTSRRYFVEGMKASVMLRNWISKLQNLGVELCFQHECTGFSAVDANQIELSFANGSKRRFDAVCFCLGGASWEKNEKPLRWPTLFSDRDVRLMPFAASNAGLKTNWPDAFLKEAEGQPLKNILFESSRGKKLGDLVVTAYGLEGTPVYALGETGTAFLDLKPDLSLGQILKKLESVRENLSPIRRVKKTLNLSPAALALVFHLTPKPILSDLSALSSRIKRFPIELLEKQSLDESISSSGGIAWDELDDKLMLKKHPGVFAAGEMIDWDAPTGGFLIQACVSQGHLVGSAIDNFLNSRASR